MLRTRRSLLPGVAGVTEVERHKLKLELGGATVPSILLLPRSTETVPAALLLHGYSSTKERLSETMGRALAARGIANLAIDLPLHGAREDSLLADARSNPLQLMQHWRAALSESHAAIAWLRAHPGIAGGSVAAVGYSLGGYLALQTAARESGVSALIIAASGDLPVTPWTAMLRAFADPLAAARSLGGRPLLMLHGRSDRTIPPAQAQRLFDAAADPKELRWYDAGHVLPPAAADDAALWLKSRLARR